MAYIAIKIKMMRITLLLLLISEALIAQVTTDKAQACYEPIIQSIENLEGQKDAKCHATANRLEDFMYGTPLTSEARSLRMDLQQQLVKDIWSLANEKTAGEISIGDINRSADHFIKTIVSEGKIYLQTTDEQYLHLQHDDLRQYSSISYGLRAILAVQQLALFDDDLYELQPLGGPAVNKLKIIIDMSTLAVLQLSDIYARQDNAYEIGADHFQKAWDRLIHQRGNAISQSKTSPVTRSDYTLTRNTIQQKLASYQQYNDINQAVFLRNIQVYFAKAMWPSDSTESQALVTTFQDGCIQYCAELLNFSNKLAERDTATVISFDHMSRAVAAFLPYDMNEFEDVTYFPLLPAKDRIVIESYDLDAFRDSGLHWQLLGFALTHEAFRARLEPNPFALEVLTESVAQFGVLLWRVAGQIANEKDETHLSTDALLQAMDRIKKKTKSNNGRYGTEDQQREQIVSAQDKKEEDTDSKAFEDVTAAMGIDFTHRSADWLSRQLRSYVIKKESNTARLSIPPAFGGGGVAAEDINHDGYPDVLLLSGAGNRLYLNKGGEKFVDITAESGLINPSSIEGAEPRQPIFADFDNDGHQDLFISYVNAGHQIYKGDGAGKFTPMMKNANLGGEDLVGGPATAIDYNKDGLLDLYIGYFGNYLKGELPTLARHNTNGSPNQLFMNTGNFQFINKTAGSNLNNNGWTQAVGHTDIDNDGWQDIIVGNDFGVNAYYINNGDGTFSDKAKELGTDKPSYTMNVGIADLNRDQYPDFYISNIVVMEKDDKYVLPNSETKMHFDPNSLSTMRVLEANDLFLSRQKADTNNFELSSLIDRGYAYTGWSWDADFFDFDNDGDEDLYCVNGMNPYSVYGQNNEYYSSPDGSSAEVQYAKSQEERNVFFKNEGGRLMDYSEASGTDLLGTSRSATYLDYDLDGDLDILLSNYHGDAILYQNNTSGNNWISIQLEDHSQGANRDAIGARILVSTDDQHNIWREIHSTDGYLSAHPKAAHIGLGQAGDCSVIVTWPDGETSTHRMIATNQKMKIIRHKDGRINIITE